MLIREEYKLEPSDLWSILHDIGVARGVEALEAEDIKFVGDLGDKDFDDVFTDAETQRLRDLTDNCEEYNPNLLKGFIDEHLERMTYIDGIDRGQMLKVKPFVTRGVTKPSKP